MALCHYKADDDIDDIVAALTTTGAVVVENVLSDDIIDALSHDLRPEFDREGHLYQNTFNGHQTLRVGGVAKYSRYFSDLLLDPVVLAVADAILKPY